MNQIQSEKFRKLLADFSTAMLITHGQKPHFRARPMAIARVDASCDLWFLTGAESAKVHEIEKDTRVLVVCQNGWNSCVSIAGRASLDYDQAKIQGMWNSAYQAWFPKGPSDPNIVLIHVVGEQAEYWDNSGVNAFTYAYQTIKALVTGTTPEVKEGDQHGVVNMAKS